MFTGNQSDTEQFVCQFNIYWQINDKHEVMKTPYYRALAALTCIKGRNVNDWQDEQVTALWNKVERPVNPMDWSNPVLWDDFVNAFTNAFVDMTKKQKLHIE